METLMKELKIEYPKNIKEIINSLIDITIIAGVTYLLLILL